jgi:hypothetical protein
MKATWLKWGNRADEKSRMGPLIGSAILGGSIIALLAAVGFSARPDSKLSPIETERAEAAAVLRAALDRRSTDAIDRLAEAGTRAAKILGEDSLVAQDLLRVLERSKEDPASMRKAFEDAHSKLTFRPLMEAELPRGFPAPGPLGEIRVKQYPAYRMAVSESGGSAFWSLFRHIKRNEIAMTAPVEMGYGDAELARPAEQTMAFLYGAPEMGRTGTDGNIEVVDARPLTVVSMGFNGRRSDAMIEQARDRLMTWIAQTTQFEPTGSLRVLGYNSPFVPRDRQYWEVQIPLQSVDRRL